jgi:hypothetical protein
VSSYSPAVPAWVQLGACCGGVPEAIAGEVQLLAVVPAAARSTVRAPGKKHHLAGNARCVMLNGQDSRAEEIGWQLGESVVRTVQLLHLRHRGELCTCEPAPSRQCHWIATVIQG